MVSDIIGSLVVWHVLVTVMSWVEELLGIDEEHQHNFTFFKNIQNKLILWVFTILYKIIKWHVVTLLDTISWAALWLMLYLFGRDDEKAQQHDEATVISIKKRNLEGYCIAQAQQIAEEPLSEDPFEGQNILGIVDSHEP